MNALALRRAHWAKDVPRLPVMRSKPGRGRLRVINERVHTVEVPLLRPLELPRAA
jgi:hypothetical protein